MGSESLTQTEDPQIFNDYDFYQTLLKDFLNRSGAAEEVGENSDGVQDEFLNGADLGITQDWIAKRRKLLQD